MCVKFTPDLEASEKKGVTYLLNFYPDYMLNYVLDMLSERSDINKINFIDFYGL